MLGNKSNLAGKRNSHQSKSKSRIGGLNLGIGMTVGATAKDTFGMAPFSPDNNNFLQSLNGPMGQNQVQLGTLIGPKASQRPPGTAEGTKRANLIQ